MASRELAVEDGGHQGAMRASSGTDGFERQFSPIADFSAMYERHAPHLRRFVLFLSGDPALADDLVSETFIRVWNARTRVDLTTVRGYLFAIARNLFLESRRRARHDQLNERLVDLEPGPETVLVRPDPGHLRMRVAWDHVSEVSTEGTREMSLRS